eukprot:15350655-Ditylum_brightwellii.AAC.1
MRPTLNWDDTKTVDDHSALFDEEVDEDELEDKLFASEIKDAKYDAVTPEEVRGRQNHLSSVQWCALETVLETAPTLFDGKLGHYKKRKCRLELNENAQPFHLKAYSAPQTHEETFKRELQHLIKIGVLQPCGPTE